ASMPTAAATSWTCRGHDATHGRPDFQDIHPSNTTNRTPTMALNELMRFPEVVPLIPGSGVQFLDFGFSIDKQSDVPREWRLVVAADTTLLDFVDSEAYLAPSPGDARNGNKFSLPGHKDSIDWYFDESWVKDWCLETFKEMHEREERRRRQFSFRPLGEAEL